MDLPELEFQPLDVHEGAGQIPQRSAALEAQSGQGENKNETRASSAFPEGHVDSPSIPRLVRYPRVPLKCRDDPGQETVVVVLEVMSVFGDPFKVAEEEASHAILPSSAIEDSQ